MYFNSSMTKDELKVAYRNLCKTHHPDRGGDTETMQAINAAYEDAIRGVYRAAGMTEREVVMEMDLEEVFMQKIQTIAGMEGIVIEIIGRWIWVTGNTFLVKDVLKSVGFFWASKKRAWFWRLDEDKSANRKNWTLDEVRGMHGSKIVSCTPQKMLMAA